MKKLFSIIAVACASFFSRCQEVKPTTKTEGDLYFAKLRYGSFYGLPDSEVNRFLSYVDTMDVASQSNANDPIFQTYLVLKKENRLYSPYIDLRQEDSSVITMYLDSTDYDKIKIYKRAQLQAENKKIRIKADTRVVGDRLIFCTKLISVERVEGITLQQEKKFKIEDYQ